VVMNRFELTEIARAARQNGTQFVMRPQFTTKQVRASQRLADAVSRQQAQPASETTIGSSTTTDVLFAWGIHGFPPDEDVPWVMV
jgi:hypothetical protein